MRRSRISAFATSRRSPHAEHDRCSEPLAVGGPSGGSEGRRYVRDRPSGTGRRAGRPAALVADAHLVGGAQGVEDHAQPGVDGLHAPLMDEGAGHHTRLTPLATLGVGAQAAGRSRPLRHGVRLLMMAGVVADGCHSRRPACRVQATARRAGLFVPLRGAAALLHALGAPLGPAELAEGHCAAHGVAVDRAAKDVLVARGVVP